MNTLDDKEIYVGNELLTNPGLLFSDSMLLSATHQSLDNKPKNNDIIEKYQARKYVKQDISDERLREILGYLSGLADTVIRQERKSYEQGIKKHKEKT